MTLRAKQRLALFSIISAVTAAAPAASAQTEASAEKVPASAPSVSLPSLTVDAEHLVLGQQEQAAINLLLPAGSEAPQISASVGEVSELKQVEGQHYQARYRTPDEFYPQPAIIAAVWRRHGRSVYSWTVLPLWGQGEAAIQAHPKTSVWVKVAGQRFGPVRADNEGIARVPLVVPPGVNEAWRGHKKVALNLPPAQRLHLVLAPAHVAGDEPQTVTAFLFAVDAAGQPSSASLPQLEAFGAHQQLTALGQGVWRASVAVPPGKPATFSLVAKLPEAPELASQQTIFREPGPPSRLALELPARAGVTPETLRVKVTDSLGTPVDAKPQAGVDQGQLDPLVRMEQGVYEALWRPPVIPKAPRTTVIAKLSNGASGQRTVIMNQYVPPPPWWSTPPVLWTGVGTTAALLATGLITRGIALKQSSEYKDPATSIDRRRELKDSGEALTLTSNITLGIAAAAAAATAALYYWGKPHKLGEELEQHAAGRSHSHLSAWSITF